MSELRDVTCRIGSDSVTCHQTQVNTPRINRRPVLDLHTRWGKERRAENKCF